MLFSTLRSARRKNASYLPRQPQRCDKHRHFDDEHGLTATSFGSKGKGLASCLHCRSLLLGLAASEISGCHKDGALTIDLVSA